MGRPLGVKNKPKEIRRITRERMRQLLDGTRPEGQAEKRWVEAFVKLPFKEQFRTRMMLEPKDAPERVGEASEAGPAVTFHLHGVRPAVCPYCGKDLPVEDPPPRRPAPPARKDPEAPWRGPKHKAQTSPELVSPMTEEEKEQARLRAKLAVQMREAEEEWKASEIPDWRKPL